jgi:serine/threonine protein kinase
MSNTSTTFAFMILMYGSLHVLGYSTISEAMGQNGALSLNISINININMLTSPSSVTTAPPPPPQTRASKYSAYSGPDGKLVPWREIMRIGGHTLTLRREDRVIKIPKKASAIVYSSSYQPLALEIKVYERLGNHKGIAEILQRSDGTFEMPYYKNGSLEDFLHQNPELPVHQKCGWIRGLVDTLDYIHHNRVLYFDLFLPNILVTDSLALVFIDFGDSSAILSDTTFLEFSNLSYEGASVHTDIFYLGWIMYSLERWKSYSFDLFAMPQTLDDRDKPLWPELSELPDTGGMRYGRVIRKCWLREYQNMKEVREDIFNKSEVLLTAGGSFSRDGPGISF